MKSGNRAGEGTVGGSNKAVWGTKLPPTSTSALAMVRPTVTTTEQTTGLPESHSH